MTRATIDITTGFFADVVRRWAIACGEHPQSARVHVHNRSASVACGSMDRAATIYVTGDDFAHVVQILTLRMLSEIGERGDYVPALLASSDALERARSAREAEATTPATEGT